MKLSDALGDVSPKALGAQAPKRLSPSAPKSLSAETARNLPLQGVAKSAHPDFAPVKVYVRKRTRRDAEYKFQSAGGGDLSDLVEELLQKYLGA